MPHAFDQIFAVAFQCQAQQFRVRQNEVGGGDGVGDLGDVELCLMARVFIQPLGVMDHVLRPFARDQVELLDEIKELVFFPLRIGKALVSCRRFDGRCRRFAHHPFQRGIPEIYIAAPQA